MGDDGGTNVSSVNLSREYAEGQTRSLLPQGYLRGFIDPARENEEKLLWKLNIPSKQWAEKSTKALGFVHGFYDYAGSGPEIDSLPSADGTFSELENEFPAVREKLLSLRKMVFAIGRSIWTSCCDTWT